MHGQVQFSCSGIKNKKTREEESVIGSTSQLSLHSLDGLHEILIHHTGHIANILHISITNLPFPGQHPLDFPFPSQR